MPSGSAFPATRASILERIRSADPAVRNLGFDLLVTGYWKPVYKYLRVRWGAAAADAQDLTQSFFATALEKHFFDRFDPAQARFRTFVRVCLDRFVQNQRRAERAQKRGGGARAVTLDFADAEGELRHHDAAAPDDVDRFFHQEAVRALFERAVHRVRDELHASGKGAVFRVFERYDLTQQENVTYANVAGELGLPVTQVTNHLAAARRLFRARLLEELREMSGTEAEYRAEARELLGVDVA
jgi:DNA-directed RNA polymerase specialized sigma24 family protein